MRLIDAGALKNIYAQIIAKLEAVSDGNIIPLIAKMAISALMDCIEYQPTIDAKPVVHARWREFYPPKEFILTGEEKLYICSNCDAKYSDIENQKFCPWCGAQMDENE